MSTTEVQGLVLGTALVFTVLWTAVFFAALRTMRRGKLSLTRIVAATVIICGVLFSPGLIDHTIRTVNRTSGLTRVFIDPGWGIMVSPALIGLVAAAVLQRRGVRKETAS